MSKYSRRDLKDIYDQSYYGNEIPDVIDNPSELYVPYFISGIDITTEWYSYNNLGSKTYLLKGIIICSCGIHYYSTEACHNCGFYATIDILERYLIDDCIEWLQIVTPDDTFITGIPCITQYFGPGYCCFFRNKYYIIINNVIFIADEILAKWIVGHLVWHEPSCLNEDSPDCGISTKYSPDCGISTKYADCYGNIYSCKLYRETDESFYVLLNNICVHVCPKYAKVIYNNLFYVENSEIVVWNDELQTKPIISQELINELKKSAKQAILVVIIDHYPIEKYFIAKISYDYEIAPSCKGGIYTLTISQTVTLRKESEDINKSSDTKKFTVPWSINKYSNIYHHIVEQIKTAATYSAFSIIHDAHHAVDKIIKTRFATANNYFSKTSAISKMSIISHSFSCSHKIINKCNLCAVIKLSAKVCIQTEAISMIFIINKTREVANIESIYEKNYIDTTLVIKDTAEKAALLVSEEILTDIQINNIHTALINAKHEFDVIAIVTIIKTLNELVYSKSALSVKTKDIFYIKSAVSFKKRPHKTNAVIIDLVLHHSAIPITQKYEFPIKNMLSKDELMSFIEAKSKMIISDYISYNINI